MLVKGLVIMVQLCTNLPMLYLLSCKTSDRQFLQGVEDARYGFRIDRSTEIKHVSSVAKSPVKFQSDVVILTPSPMTLIFGTSYDVVNSERPGVSWNFQYHIKLP